MKKLISYFMYIVLISVASQISGIFGIQLTVLLLLVNVLSFYLVLLIFLVIKFKIRKSYETCDYNPELFCPKNIWHNAIIESVPVLYDNKIMDDNTLMEKERKFTGKIIWLMSLDYSYEANFENGFSDVVNENLKRGIHYCMFALNSDLSEQRARDISNYYKKYAYNITFVLMNNSPLELMLPLYNFMIMNPTKIDRKGYICIGENDDASNTLFKELDRALLEKVCARCKCELEENRNIIFSGNKYVE